METWCARAAARIATASLLALAALSIAAPAAAAGGGERDICENKSGAELIRCIEAAARSPAAAPAPDAAKARPPLPAGRESEIPTKRGAESPPVRRAGKPITPGAERPAAARKAIPAEADPAARTAPPSGRPGAHGGKSSAVAGTPTSSARPPQDCSGRSGEALRHCLAAGGRLAPALAGGATTAPARSAAVPDEPCEGKSGEALRQCIELRSKREADARAVTPSQVIACTGYAAADQPLCVHRNSAIVECRNRRLYPDFDVCFRSQMANAPEPPRAECGKLPERARAHCEARNRVFSACTGDRLGYFACLERQLGPDAVITRR
jgi:hypothetical protein